MGCKAVMKLNQSVQCRNGRGPIRLHVRRYHVEPSLPERSDSDNAREIGRESGLLCMPNLISSGFMLRGSLISYVPSWMSVEGVLQVRRYMVVSDHL